MSQATKANFLESAPFHQDLEARVEQCVEASGRSPRDSSYRATVFQLAHCVYTLPNDWAAHQVQSTGDFARNNPRVSWYLGGLYFQVVHHLFPRVCYLHAPALSRIVEATCREHGVNESVGAVLKSHVHWLKRMGQPVLEGAV